MRKRLLLGIATLAAAGAAVPALAASQNAAQTEQMFDEGVVNCESGMSGGTPTQGFAVIKLSPDGTVISAQVSLKDAVPNATYAVHIDQTPRGPCRASVGTIQTNGQGNGNAYVSAPLAPGTTDAAVFANNLDFPIDTQGTPDYVFGNK